MTDNGKNKVTVLGINGHIGHAAAQAFVEAGWDVVGFGRSNKNPIAGVTFVKGDADNIADMEAAIGDAEVVLHALHLPYDKWGDGAAERQTARVIAAMGTTGKTLMFPGTIYNYAASLRLVTPEAPQIPERPRGAIRVNLENLLRDAAGRGDMQVMVIRAGDFFKPGDDNWFAQAIVREKGTIAMLGPREVGHSWAYLPDLGRAFEKLAWHRKELGSFENFHFSGHFVTSGELAAAVQKAAPMPMQVTRFSWALVRAFGLINPIMREIFKMHYLWENPMRLTDARLDRMLGPDFGTPYSEAIAAAVTPLLEKVERAA